MYTIIKNPTNNKWVDINSKKGKKIIYNYIFFLYPNNKHGGANMPFDLDKNTGDMNELSKFRYIYNGDLNASLPDIKIGWKNYYSWKENFIQNTKRLFSERGYISDPQNFASILQIGVKLDGVQRVINHVISLCSTPAEFDEYLHYEAAQEYIKTLEALKTSCENISKQEHMDDNKQFIASLSEIIENIRININKSYPVKPPKKTSPIIIVN